MFQKGELESLAVATGLILLNIGVIWAFAFTPLAAANNVLFNHFIIGVAVYGVLLSAGLFIAKRGVRDGNTGMAVGGTSLVQFAYGMFGAGVISMLSPSIQALALGTTAVATTAIAVICGLAVFGTDHDFSSWGKYANYIFLGVFGLSLVGTFSAGMIIFAFFLALIGFIVYLVDQIYRVKVKPGQPFMNGIGLYTAYMGVFVEILQMIVYMLLDE
ncbi:Bax inhibitor-1 family protein [Candidatus Nanohalococcus occultus]|uniref:Membrane protein n=1 Tax=Candidatus Nanohalococcus occultus TaxID=2978047 RepID=A0ABY8CD87_9ARCH|nr:putative membrane protein [Candidatus Nanohaloarchaeota archaeon SVXNc]